MSRSFEDRSVTNTLVAVTDLTQVVERYGIWERKPSGSVRPIPEDYTNLLIAQQVAEEYNASEKEQEAMERGGPVKREYSTFFVVRQTTSFEESV